METLASKIARHEKLGDADAVGWILRLARTLEPVHALGFAHGNVTAEAIQIAGPAPAARGLLVDPGHLHPLAAYHSPERTNGAEISPEDDTWGAAVTLYFTLTGTLPFPGTDAREVRRRILGSRPAPLSAFGAGDDVLQGILDRAFSRDRQRRISSLFDLREALGRWHPEPAARSLPPLDHAGSLLLALGAKAAAAETPAKPTRAVVPAIYNDEEEEEDGPTKVRDPSTLQAHLAALRAPPASAPDPILPTADAPLDEPPPGDLPIPGDAPSAALPPPDLPIQGAPVPAAVPAPNLPISQAAAPKAPPAAFPPAKREVSPPPGASPPAPAAPAPPSPAAPVLPAAPTPPSPAAPVLPAAPTPPSPAAPVLLAAPAPPSPAVPVLPAAPAPAPTLKVEARSWTPILAGLAFVIVCGAAGLFLFRHKASSDPQPPGTSPSTSPGPSGVPGTSTSTVAAESLSASGEPLAAASTSSSAVPATSTSAAPATSSSAVPTAGAACMMPLFATGSFVDPPASLDSLCQITDPRKGARTVRTEVIRGSAHRGVSDGMREWAILGWYGMPAFAILYTMCCPSAPELHIPFPIPTCDLEGAMKALAAAAASPTSSDDDVAAALKAYTKAAKCTAQAGFNDSFDQMGDIQEGELATFQKTLDRARARRAPQ